MNSQNQMLRVTSAVPSSRRRSLVRDVARGLGQQMFFWGCDARHPAGNLLCRAGLERLAREEKTGEGSSRYRMPWEGGLIELHSFCLGWYGGESPFPGAIFIRGSERLYSCVGPEPLAPGRYERSRLTAGGVDQLLVAVRPLVRWLLGYEERVRALAGTSYRDECWRRYGDKAGARPWLAPAVAESWWREMLVDVPQKRPRDLKRGAQSSSSCHAIAA